MQRNGKPHKLLVGMCMVQPLWKIVGQFLKLLNISLPYDPATNLPGEYPREMKTHTDYYRHTSFYCTLQTLEFLQIEGLWQPCIEQADPHHFSNSICSLCFSVSRFGNSWTISSFFIIMVICNQ